MTDDEEPVKDVGMDLTMSPMNDILIGNRSASQGHLVAKLTRKELEDRHFKILEENDSLKRHGRKQEDKIRRLTAKVVRLVNEWRLRRSDPSRKSSRMDIEQASMLQEAQSRVRELENQNSLLQERLTVAHHQLAEKRHMRAQLPFRAADVANTSKKRNSRNTSHSVTKKQSAVTQEAVSLLRESHIQNQHLEEVISTLREQITLYEQELEQLREEYRIKDLEREEEILRLQEQMGIGERKGLEEGIQLLKLHRESKGNAAKLQAVQRELHELQVKSQQDKWALDAAKLEIEDITNQFEAEQKRNLDLQKDIQELTLSRHIQKQLQQQLKDLKDENNLLKETNDKLTAATLVSDSDSSAAKENIVMKLQVAHLEAAAKADQRERASLLNQIGLERSQVQKLEEKLQHSQHTLSQVQDERNRFQKLLRDLNIDESGTDMSKIKDALQLLKQQRECLNNSMNESANEKSENKENLEEIEQLRLQVLDATEEVDKAKYLLRVQCGISNDLKEQVHSLQAELQKIQKEQKEKLEESSHILHLHNVHMQSLQDKFIQTYMALEPISSKVSLPLHLGQAEVVFELHLGWLILTPSALKIMSVSTVDQFVTWNFFGQSELQTSPFFSGTAACFDHSIAYTVSLEDDAFRHFLTQESVSFNWHASGSELGSAIASGNLNLADLLHFPGNRIHSTVSLLGVKSNEHDTVFATLQVCAQLHNYNDMRKDTRKIIEEQPLGSETHATTTSSPIPVPPTPKPRPRVSVPHVQEKVVLQEVTAVQETYDSDLSEVAEDLQTVLPKRTMVVTADVHISTAGSSETDSDVSSSTDKSQDETNIEIHIEKLNLNPNVPALKDPAVSALFVEFDLLTVPQDECESPSSLPKPEPGGTSFEFDFYKIISMDKVTQAKRRDAFSSMLKRGDKTCFLKFTIVSEPPDDEQSWECQEIGMCQVDLCQMMKRGKDLIQYPLPVVEADGKSKIGSLIVTVKAVKALKSVSLATSSRFHS